MKNQLNYICVDTLSNHPIFHPIFHFFPIFQKLEIWIEHLHIRIEVIFCGPTRLVLGYDSFYSIKSNLKLYGSTWLVLGYDSHTLPLPLFNLSIYGYL